MVIQDDESHHNQLSLAFQEHPDTVYGTDLCKTAYSFVRCDIICPWSSGQIAVSCRGSSSRSWHWLLQIVDSCLVLEWREIPDAQNGAAAFIILLDLVSVVIALQSVYILLYTPLLQVCYSIIGSKHYSPWILGLLLHLMWRLGPWPPAKSISWRPCKTWRIWYAASGHVQIWIAHVLVVYSGFTSYPGRL